jgi:hypothetical protein
MSNLIGGWIPAVTASVVTALFFVGCSGPAAVSPVTEPTVDWKSLPGWVLKRITELGAQPVANPPAFMARYWYRDQVVYFVPSLRWHSPSVLYDADGNILCFPSGGNERGGSKCPDFFQERANEEIVWRDERPPPRSSHAPELLFLGLAALQVVHITLMD